MPAALFAAFDWIKNNKAVQIVLAVVLIALGLRSYGAWKEHQGRVKQKAKDAQETRNTLDKIEEKSDARIEQAEAIRAANPVTGDPDRVSEQPPISRWNYRD